MTGSPKKEEVRIESAIAIIDHKTGYVVAGTSGFGEKTEAWGFNRITGATHSPGSSIKPLAVIGPSLEERKITAATVVEDSPVTFGNYSPKNDTGGYLGLMNIRYILRVSRNIPEVKMMKNLSVKKSLEYLAKFGLDTSTEQNDGLSLALGGMSQGPTVLQMAAAYAAIANYGEYIEPSFYKEVTDAEGKEILGEHQEKTRVLSKQNAWILQTLLQEPTGTGLTGTSGATATGAKVKNQFTAGKTGTTNESKAVWFCGFTPYYSGAVWMGYDIESDGKAGKSGTAARLWGAVMNTIHEGKSAIKFEEPNGIRTALVCSKSGLLASDTCKSAGYAYNEYFVEGTVPEETCVSHTKISICNISGKLANEYCTDVTEQTFTSSEEVPTEKCTDCTKPVENVIDTNTVTPPTNTITPPNTNTTSTPTTTTSKPTNEISKPSTTPTKPSNTVQ